MIKQALASLLTVTLAFTLAGEGLAAESSVALQMYDGLTNRQPKNWTVSPAADQIAARNVIGADIKNANGITIAKITDIIIDRNLGTAAVAIIAPAGTKPFDNGKQSAVAWSSLQFEPRPLPHFATKLDQNALDAGTALLKRGDR